MNKLLLRWLRIVREEEGLIGEKEEREKKGESSREHREGTIHLEERGERECMSKKREKGRKDNVFFLCHNG